MRDFSAANDRFGLKATFPSMGRYVYFTPRLGHWPDYSITSSARASSIGGTVRPSILAVWALMTSSNFDRLHDRQICRLGALEHASGVDAGLAPRLGVLLAP